MAGFKLEDVLGAVLGNQDQSAMRRTSQSWNPSRRRPAGGNAALGRAITELTRAAVDAIGKMGQGNPSPQQPAPQRAPAPPRGWAGKGVPEPGPWWTGPAQGQAPGQPPQGQRGWQDQGAPIPGKPAAQASWDDQPRAGKPGAQAPYPQKPGAEPYPQKPGWPAKPGMEPYPQKPGRSDEGGAAPYPQKPGWPAKPGMEPYPQKPGRSDQGGAEPYPQKPGWPGPTGAAPDAPYPQKPESPPAQPAAPGRQGSVPTTGPAAAPPAPGGWGASPPAGPAPGPWSAPAAPPATPATAEHAEALLLIRTMIAAAKADGAIDAEERGGIARQLDTAGLSPAERDFVLADLDRPLSPEALAAEAHDPMLAAQLYAAAFAATHAISPGERAWLDSFARALRLDRAAVDAIEKRLGTQA